MTTENENPSKPDAAANPDATPEVVKDTKKETIIDIIRTSSLKPF